MAQWHLDMYLLVLYPSSAFTYYFCTGTKHSLSFSLLLLVTTCRMNDRYIYSISLRKNRTKGLNLILQYAVLKEEFVKVTILLYSVTVLYCRTDIYDSFSIAHMSSFLLKY
jgi:hypothetical protein